MKKNVIILLGALALNITAQAQRVVHDTKTMLMVGQNTGVAEGNEVLYHAQVDSTRKKRASLLSKVTVRNMMKSADMLSRKSLGNLTAEGAAYSAICHETSRLLKSINNLLGNAAEHSENMPYCYKQAAEVVMEAKGYVEQTIAIAMNGKVPNPFNFDAESLAEGKIANAKTFEEEEMTKSPKDRKTDGPNLILADERIKICNQTIYGLRRLRRMVNIISFRLQCNYTWRDAMAKTLGYKYYWAMGMAGEVKRTKNSIENAPWW